MTRLLTSRLFCTNADARTLSPWMYAAGSSFCISFTPPLSVFVIYSLLVGSLNAARAHLTRYVIVYCASVITM